MNLDDSLRDETIINGHFEDTAALAQAIKMIFRRGKNWDPLTPDAKEALELAATSIARILNGDSNDFGHWNSVASIMRMRAKKLTPELENNISRLARLRVQPRVLEPAQSEDEQA